MTSEAEAAPASQVSGSSWFEWLLFPSRLVSQNREIERGLAALIWVAMPFVLYLLCTRPGGLGKLIKDDPVYFFLTVAYVIAVVVVTFLALWGLTRLVSAGTTAATRSGRKIVLRAWMDAIFSCFALTAIALSASIWISNEWLQDRSSPVTIDAVSRAMNLDEGDWGTHVVGYGYALVAALTIGLVVRRLTRREVAADATRAERLPQTRNPFVFLAGLLAYLLRNPMVFLVALFAYLILIVPMRLTELPMPFWRW